MPELFDHVGFLSQEIGPRPAGTEEEQRAADYIADQLQNEAGLETQVEDFSCSAGGDKHWLICAGVTVVAAILSLVLSFMAVPALILTVLSAVVVLLEYLGKPILSGRGKQGMSQNVVARYVPAGADVNPVKRKIIVVARYDSEKVMAETGGFFGKNLTLLKKLWLGGMVATAVLILVKTVFFLHTTGVVAIVFAALTIIAVILSALPLIFALLHKLAPFSPAANTSASGPAMLVELAARVNQVGGRAYEAPQQDPNAISGFGPFDSIGASEDDVEIYGAQAAYEAGVVPEGAELEYEDGLAAEYAGDFEEYDASESFAFAGANRAVQPGFDPMAPDGIPFDQGADSDDPVERLLAAKRAIAALTGKPLDITVDPAVAEAMRRNAGVAADALGSTGEIAGLDAVDQMDAAEFAEEIETVPGSLGFDQKPQAFPAAPAGIAAAFVGAATTVPEEFQVPVAVAEADGAEPVAEAGQEIAAAVEAEPEVSGFSDVPDWFRKARANARKQEDAGEIQRSRFASALDKAEATFAAAAAEEQAAQAEVAEVELGERLRQMQADIMEVQAPKLDMERIESIFDAEEEQVDDFAVLAAEAAALAEDDGAVYADEPEPEVEESFAGQPTLFENEIPSLADVALAASDDVDAELPAVVDQEENELQEEVELPEELAAEEEAAPVQESVPDLFALLGSESLVAQRPKSAKFDEETVAPERAVLRATLPSFSGIIANTSAMRALVEEGEAQEDPLAAMRLPELNLETNVINDQRVDFTADAVSGSAGMTGAFAPVGDELLAEAQAAEAENDVESMYIDDADDSVFEGNFTETGAFAGPGYMDMPKSRKRRLFGRRKRAEAELDMTPQQWLNVEDGFDARTVGAERGGWESFREDDLVDEFEQPTTAFDMSAQFADDQDFFEEDFQEEPFVNESGFQEEPLEEAFEDEFENDFEPIQNTGFGGSDFYSFKQGRWNGGAFSLRGFGKKQVVASGDLDSYNDAYAGEIVEDYDEDFEGSFAAQDGFSRGGNTLEFTEESYEEDAGFDDYEDYGYEDEPAAMDAAEGLNRIGQFRGASVETEVWFVALGGQGAKNAGIKAFYDAHQAELRGATVIEIDAVAAGDLCAIQKEGSLKASTVSNRLNRIARSVADGMGLPLGEADLLWHDGAASFVQHNNGQAIHLAGMHDGMPALYNAKHDNMENLDPEIFAENIEYLTALLENL